MIYWQLFVSFLQVGLFSIGGGYAAMPLIQSQVVTGRGWITLEEFTNLVTIAEMTPGPIVVNSATFVGNRVAGLGGALTATVGSILPSLVIVTLLAYLYYKYRGLSLMQGLLKGLRPAVVALIASAGVTIFSVAALNGSFDLKNVNFLGLALFAAALLLLLLAGILWGVAAIVQPARTQDGGVLTTQQDGESPAP